MAWLHESIFADIERSFGLTDPWSDPSAIIGVRGEGGSGRIGDLTAFPELNGVHLTSWSEPDLSDLQALPNQGARLVRVAFTRSLVPDIAPLGQLRSLAQVHFINAQTFDLRPIADLPELAVLSVQGCALDEHSYRVILPQLRAAGVKGRTGKELHEREWSMMQRTRERGLTVCISRNVHGESYVLAPGRHCGPKDFRGLDPAHFEEILEAIPACTDAEFVLAAEAWSWLTTYQRQVADAVSDPEKFSDERLARSIAFSTSEHLRYADVLGPLMTPTWRRRFGERWTFAGRS